MSRTLQKRDLEAQGMSPCAELPPACQAAGSAVLAGSEELLGTADSLRAAGQTADVNPHPEVLHLSVPRKMPLAARFWFKLEINVKNPKGKTKC